MCPAGDGVFVVADQGHLTLNPAARGWYGDKRHRLRTSSGATPNRRRLSATGNVNRPSSGRTRIVHLVQVQDPFQPTTRSEETGQQATPSGRRLVTEAIPGPGQPAKGRASSRKAPAY